MSEVSAFVLAGGQSTRMGTDKAFLDFEGKPLISRALALAKTMSSDVRILGSPEKFRAYGMVVEDEFPNHGPLGGIYAALRCSNADLNLILAVDMPFVESRFLQYLLDRQSPFRGRDRSPRRGRMAATVLRLSKAVCRSRTDRPGARSQQDRSFIRSHRNLCD